MNRHDDLGRFYRVLKRLEEQVGGKRYLRDLANHRDWPSRGVYVFFEPGEGRSDSGEGTRVVRVGTHALTKGSRSTLRQRLRQHRGSAKGGGNHRGSIFRLLVGQALIAKGDVAPCLSWGVGGNLAAAANALLADRDELRAAEVPVEEAVSDLIGAMPFLWLDVGDEPSPQSLRGYIERNAIALLSNFERTPLDPASESWLGRHSNRSPVTRSGLWNQCHVTENHDPEFLTVLGKIVERMTPSSASFGTGPSLSV